MKNLKYIFLIAIIGVGCEDILDTVPNDRLSAAVYWQTENDAVFGANALYRHLESPDRFAMWDGLSDVGHMNQVWGAASEIERNNYTALNLQVQNEWTSYYSGIQSANAFLENVDRIETVNTTLINQLKGEVRTLRAYYYHKLVSIYGDIPIITSQITLEESKTVSRDPAAQVWDFIIQELTEAAPLLPTVASQKGRVTKGAALALKARSQLYAGKNAEAATTAKEVMDLGIYTLYSSYQNLFTYAAQNNSEVILDKQFLKGTYNHKLFYLYSPASIWPRNDAFEVVPTKKLVDSYQMTNGANITDVGSGFDPFNPYLNRDPRLGYSVIYPGTQLLNGSIYDSRPGSGTGDEVGTSQSATSTGFNVKKYLNQEDLNDPQNCGVNVILIRYAEVLLTYAEGKIEANQIDQSVLDAINQVRQRADVNMPVITTTNQTELRAIVRNERKVELAFEGLRYFDIRRWGIAEQVIPGVIQGITYTDGSGNLATVSLSLFNKIFTSNRDYLWPIPQKDLDLTQLTQNPNW